MGRKIRSKVELEYDRYNIYDDNSDISETEDDFNDAVQRADNLSEANECKVYVYDTYANELVYETPSTSEDSDND
jgi:hypothetical protein